MNVLIPGFDCGGGEFEGIGIPHGSPWLEDAGLAGDPQGSEGGGDAVGAGTGDGASVQEVLGGGLPKGLLEVQVAVSLGLPMGLKAETLENPSLRVRLTEV